MRILQETLISFPGKTSRKTNPRKAFFSNRGKTFERIQGRTSGKISRWTFLKLPVLLQKQFIGKLLQDFMQELHQELQELTPRVTSGRNLRGTSGIILGVISERAIEGDKKENIRENPWRNFWMTSWRNFRENIRWSFCGTSTTILNFHPKRQVFSANLHDASLVLGAFTPVTEKHDNHYS